LQPQSLTIQYNDDESHGRAVCDSGLDMKSSLRDYGAWVLLLLVLLLLFMAKTTSQLPSLFNETQVIYELAFFSIVLLILGLGVSFVTHDPATSPAVAYLAAVFLTLSIAASSALRIMLPKLRMVWRDEKVVVSKLVSDHAKNVREDDELYTIETSRNATPTERATTNSTNSSDFDEGCDHSQMPVLDVDNDCLVNTPNTEEMDSSPDPSAGFLHRGRPNPRNKRSLVRRIDSLPSRRNVSNTIMVQCDEAPARRLVLKMMNLQEQLVAVNGRIMSGIQVSERDWIAVRELTSKLGATFNDEVNFSWENNMPEGPAPVPKKDLGSKTFSRHVISEGEPKVNSEH
jgi:hypothetical protein